VLLLELRIRHAATVVGDVERDGLAVVAHHDRRRAHPRVAFDVAQRFLRGAIDQLGHVNRQRRARADPYADFHAAVARATGETLECDAQVLVAAPRRIEVTEQGSQRADALAARLRATTQGRRQVAAGRCVRIGREAIRQPLKLERDAREILDHGVLQIAGDAQPLARQRLLAPDAM
jgi:hypothetical protein